MEREYPLPTFIAFSLAFGKLRLIRVVLYVSVVEHFGRRRAANGVEES